MVPSSTSSNTNTSSATTVQTHGQSDIMPHANNMLVNGRGGSGANSPRPNAAACSTTASTSGSPTSSTMQQLPRPSSTARGNVAAFLTKLYNMVNDEASNNLIKWSDDGQSFIVLRHVDFAKEVLPKFFKHNNFSSFVRQLNMYGFHKVPHLQQGVLLPDSDSEQWEFSNPHFQKNQPDLLCLVSRKKASNGSDDKDALTMDLGHILQEVTAIKKHQIAISSDLKNIERDHQSLWQESITARERHQRQQETIDKILRFLASVFSGEKKRAIVPTKKPRLTITEGDIEEEYEVEAGHASGGEHEEHEEEVTKLLGSKRKRASMVESEADYTLPGMEATLPNTKPTFSLSEMTPATLALLATASQSVQSNPTSSFSSTTFTEGPASSATTTAAALPSSSSAHAKTSDRTRTFTANLPQPPSSPPLTTVDASLPFKLDLSSLSIPSALLPQDINPAHHEMLRSISMANAQEGAQAPFPPSFTQTPAGASAVKGVNDIAKEMEQLQRSIEALEAHGLDVNGFNFDGNYLNPSAFDASAYGHLGGISESGIPYQDPLGEEGEAMNDLIHMDQGLNFITPVLGHQHLSQGQASPVASSSSPSSLSFLSDPASSVASPITPASAGPVKASTVPTSTESTAVHPKTPTVGEEYLEDLDQAGE